MKKRVDAPKGRAALPKLHPDPHSSLATRSESRGPVCVTQRARRAPPRALVSRGSAHLVWFSVDPRFHREESPNPDP